MFVKLIGLISCANEHWTMLFHISNKFNVNSRNKFQFPFYYEHNIVRLEIYCNKFMYRIRQHVKLCRRKT